MKSYIHIILVTALAILFTMVVLSIACEETKGNVDIYDAYTDHNEKHLQWNEYAGSHFGYYKVFRDDAHIGTVYEQENPQFHDKGITGGNYTYRIEAYNNNDVMTEQSKDYEVDTQFGGGSMLFDVVLTPVGGPYNFSKMVEQESGANLTVQPNTVITGGAPLNITANQKIVDNITIQGGLRFKFSDGVIVRNCVFDITGSKLYPPPGIQFLGCNDTEVYLNEFADYEPVAWPFTASPILFGNYEDDPFRSENATIHHNYFHDNYYCIDAYDLGNSTIHNNTFEDNYGSICMIDACYNIDIFDNNLTRNWGIGIHINDGYFPVSQSSGHRVCGNNFIENDEDLYMDADNVTIENNTARDGVTGFEIVGNDNIIRFNDLSSDDNETGTGVECSGERCLVAWNTIVDFRWGVSIGDDRDTRNITVEYNFIEDCGDYGVYFSGYNYHYNNIVRNNSIVRCGINLGRFEHWPQGGGIYLSRAKNTLIENNTITDNHGEGVCVHYYSDHNVIQYNNISGNRNNGIRLWPQYKSIDDIRILHNNISGNERCGIFIWGKDNVNDGYSH
ncbi:MAG: right-handed parallel beta-helix repeat-containing protein, partial [Thermoplasmata archaeon]|nr:right-handed parallel beta-helix repeat-containing protein [Thermoplasmata archaeon]